jgi:peptidyl-prolyl cis-trans isomerase B (cyclophilin B)
MRKRTSLLLITALLGISIPLVNLSTASASTVKCGKDTSVVKTNQAIATPDIKTLVKPKTYTMTVFTNCGKLVFSVDAKKAPVTVSHIISLSLKHYFDNSACHRMTTQGIDIIQCGDPTGTGMGNPGYSYIDENLPTSIAQNRYPVGTIAMANSGPNTNGSQFFLVYGKGSYDLPASYTIWGHIVSGLNILQYVASKGVAGGAADGKPAQPLVIQKISIK